MFATILAALKLRAVAVQWRRVLPWLFLVLGILAAGLALYRWIYARGVEAERPRAFLAGQLERDRYWHAQQAIAAAAHKRRAKSTETAQAAVGTKTGADYAKDTDKLRVDYDAYRAKLRAKAADRGGAAGGADLPGFPDAAGGVDGGAGSGDFVVAAPVGLIEEGDRYRAQLLRLQEWVAGVSAASAAGAAAPLEVEGAPVDLLATTSTGTAGDRR